MQEMRRRNTDLQSQNRLADLRLELLQLPIKKKRLEQELIQARRNRELEISELQDRIKLLKFRLKDQSKIESSYSGRLLELSATAGQLVTQGARVATVEVNSIDEKLKSLAYFKIKDGKRIRPGDRITVTPTNVERERWGSIVGTVEEVGPFPVTMQGALNEVGSEEIVKLLVTNGGAIEIEAKLETDPTTTSGFKWTSKGPDMKFSAGTTTTVRVIVEQRRPITYVIPMLRAWLLAEKDDHVPAF
jgi:HlyD family secretion protein